MSMGAVIAFELARNLRRLSNVEPRALFVSGRQAPQVPDPDPVTYDLPDEEFKAELRRLEGTPKEILEHAELMELLLPMLRADFKLIQTYKYVDGPVLDCPITAYSGLQDYDIRREDLSPWGEQTSSRFMMHILPGDHFFLRSSQNVLLRLLSRSLLEVIGSARLCNAKI